MFIVNRHNLNSQANISFDSIDPKGLFVAHLNIKELSKYDAYLRERAVKNIEK